LGAVPEELQLLAGLNHGVVTVLCEDGVSQDTVVVVPSMFRHAAGLPTASAKCLSGLQGAPTGSQQG
jgi:hypothetical protein